MLRSSGCSRSFSFSRWFGSGRAGVWRGLAVLGWQSVPDSRVFLPPIRAVIGVRLAGRVAHPFRFSLRSPRLRVPHPCALCKGGYHGRMRLGAFAVAQLGQMRRNENVIIGTRRCRPHRTRPCQKRKSGAPSVVLASSAIQGVGHPPGYLSGFSKALKKLFGF
jgi:hypothetical protein